MATKLTPVLVLVLFALALSAACTAPTTTGGQPAGAPTTPAQGGTPSRPQGDFSPGPVVTVPPDYFVDFQVNKNMVGTPTIEVFFSGGKGQIFLQRMLVQVQKSDGTIESKELVRPEGGQIAKGDKVSFMGTKGADRVVITFTILGKDYKVHDQLYEFKTRQ